jgi:hypothetical protein
LQVLVQITAHVYFDEQEKLRNLTPDATQSLSFAFDADLHLRKGDFSVEIERWRLKAGDHPVHNDVVVCLKSLGV